MKDKLGNTLAIGDVVAWGVKSAVRVGTVTELDVPLGHYMKDPRYDQVRTKGVAGGPGGLFFRHNVVKVLTPEMDEQLGRLEGLEQ